MSNVRCFPIVLIEFVYELLSLRCPKYIIPKTTNLVIVTASNVVLMGPVIHTYVYSILQWGQRTVFFCFTLTQYTNYLCNIGLIIATYVYPHYYLGSKSPRWGKGSAAQPISYESSFDCFKEGSCLEWLPDISLHWSVEALHPLSLEGKGSIWIYWKVMPKVLWELMPQAFCIFLHIVRG